MISFYPGPSRVHEEVPAYVNDAYKEGILSINHRSEEFMKMSEKTIFLLKSKLGIPEDYTIFYTTSATECWEIIAQSLMTGSSFHFFNGAFGKKWYEYTARLFGGAQARPFGREELIDVATLHCGTEGVICITQNETSNGTQVSQETLREIRHRYPDHLIAVDATSSMAGIRLDFAAADIWYASVQKCFGLPAGLGVMACSPAAMKQVKSVNENNHYNSLVFMGEMMDKWQTPFTPNVLGIYLLMRVMDDAPAIDVVHERTLKRYQEWTDFFADRKSISLLVNNAEARSFTVLPLQAGAEVVAAIKSRAKKSGILLGEGYGELKSSTFRIANFPAILESEIVTLREFLNDYE